MSAPGFCTPADLQTLRLDLHWAEERVRRASDPIARRDFESQRDRLARVLAAVERDMAHQVALRQQLREGAA